MNAMTRQPDPRHRPALLAWSYGRLAVIALVVGVVLAGCRGAESLAGPTWQWTAPQVTSSAGQPLTPDPVAYTVEFLTNGTINVKADCSSLRGTYSVGVPLNLTIALAPSNAACGGASLDRVFLENLGRVATYSTDHGELKLFFADKGGEMRFTNPGS
jgi:heat shock protein HslJ